MAARRRTRCKRPSTTELRGDNIRVFKRPRQDADVMDDFSGSDSRSKNEANASERLLSRLRNDAYGLGPRKCAATSLATMQVSLCSEGKHWELAASA
eukprot:5366224-Pleurochrysis_carterae.AAC.1